ncbi:MAG: type II secretion system F family protein [Candidatus Wallacebacter cryptica]
MALWISGLVFLSISLAVYSAYRQRQLAEAEAERIKLYGIGGEEQKAVDQTVGEVGLIRRTLTRLASLFSVKKQDRRWEKLNRQLVLAGNPGGLKAQEFMVLKLTITGLTAAAVVMLSPTFMHVFVFTASAWVIPDLYLRQKIKARQIAVSLAVPDLLDLLTVSVEAGLGFDAAVAKVVEKEEGPLADELRRMLSEMRIGKARRDALRDLGERTGVLYLQNFAAAVVQADQLGVSISKVLRIQAQEIRRQRRQKAEEEAMKAPIKMLLPLVTLVFPSLFIVLLGPAVLQFLAVF